MMFVVCKLTGSCHLVGKLSLSNVHHQTHSPKALQWLYRDTLLFEPQLDWAWSVQNAGVEAVRSN